jgi:hypothetical protein
LLLDFLYGPLTTEFGCSAFEVRVLVDADVVASRIEDRTAELSCVIRGKINQEWSQIVRWGGSKGAPGGKIRSILRIGQV